MSRQSSSSTTDSSDSSIYSSSSSSSSSADENVPRTLNRSLRLLQNENALNNNYDGRTVLTEINLGWNYIGTEGTKLLVTALHTNTSVRNLCLEENNIGADGCRAIHDLLKRNDTLEELYLGYNSIGDIGATWIAKGLEANTSVTILDLYCNNIHVDGCRATAQMLSRNTSLKKLDLGKNRFGDPGATELARRLERDNRTLTQLNLCFCNIGMDSFHVIERMVQVNCTLHEIRIVKSYAFPRFRHTTTAFNVEASKTFLQTLDYYLLLNKAGRGSMLVSAKKLDYTRRTTWVEILVKVVEQAILTTESNYYVIHENVILSVFFYFLSFRPEICYVE